VPDLPILELVYPNSVDVTEIGLMGLMMCYK
jgi:hypothetical protein